MNEARDTKMNVGILNLPKSASSLLQSMQSNSQNRREEVSNLLNQEDRYCGEVLTS